MTEAPDRAWLCERIVDDGPVAILYADREGKIRLWNHGAETMFGYTADEALGQSMDLIVPERQRARHWEGWERVMATGVTRYGRDVLAVPALKKDGSRISVEFNIQLLRSPSGGILGAAAVLRDVTARWEKEKEMKSRLAALEARTKEA